MITLYLDSVKEIDAMILRLHAKSVKIIGVRIQNELLFLRPELGGEFIVEFEL